MRILFWSELFWPYLGGAELFGARLISYLQSRDHDFMVITSKRTCDRPDEDHDGVLIHRFPFREALGGSGMKVFPQVVSDVIKAKARFNPDLIFMNGISASTFFHLVTNDAHPSPVIVRVNQEVLCGEKGSEATITGKVLSAANWVVCVSTSLLSQVQSLVPNLSGRSSVIRNGLEPPGLIPTALPFEAPVLLCIGRLVRQKGFDMALAAFGSICERYPKLRLVLAGDGPERENLQTQITALGLANRAELCGWVAPEHIFRLINSATVILMPSRFEGLPTVALQAGMMARPVVAMRVGGLPEVVVDRNTGLLVAPEDRAALSKAIVYLLEHPECAARMGEAARQRVTKHFGWDPCVIEYEQLFRQLTKQKTSCA